MSDDFHRPTYTSADETTNEPTNKDGLYNPTQVRLYGIPGLVERVARIGDLEVTQDRQKVRIDISNPVQARKDIASLNKLLEALAKDSEEAKRKWLATRPTTHALSVYFLELSMRLIGVVRVGSWMKDEQKLSAGVMFGYAYEGHTYDFPKPKIMLVPSFPLDDPRKLGKPKDDSGYDAKFSEGYKVWITDKLDQCVEIEVNQGFVEQLVLEANMPGKRSPSQYRAMMALAHRSGRLSD